MSLYSFLHKNARSKTHYHTQLHALIKKEK